jgi:hypothetical protein
VNAALLVDPLARVVDSDKPGFHTVAGSIRQPEFVEVQVEAGGLVQNTQAHSV